MHCSRRRLVRRGLEFHVWTINKSAHTKKVWKLIACTSYLIYMYKEYLALNNPLWLIWHEVKLNEDTHRSQYNMLCITNYSIKRQSFVYTQLNVKTVLFLIIVNKSKKLKGSKFCYVSLTIQLNIIHLFTFS